MNKHRGMPAEHRFANYETGDEWQRVVFDNALYFTTYRPTGRLKADRQKHMTFADAVAHAGADKRCLVYAVTETERSVLIAREQWPVLLRAVVRSRAKVTANRCKYCDRGGKLTAICGELAHLSCWRTAHMK